MTLDSCKFARLTCKWLLYTAHFSNVSYYSSLYDCELQHLLASVTMFHYFRVAIALGSEIDWIPAVHCRWADWFMAYTASDLYVSVHMLL